MFIIHFYILEHIILSIYILSHIFVQQTSKKYILLEVLWSYLLDIHMHTFVLVKKELSL